MPIPRARVQLHQIDPASCGRLLLGRRQSRCRRRQPVLGPCRPRRHRRKGRHVSVRANVVGPTSPALGGRRATCRVTMIERDHRSSRGFTGHLVAGEPRVPARLAGNGGAVCGRGWDARARRRLNRECRAREKLRAVRPRRARSVPLRHRHRCALRGHGVLRAPGDRAAVGHPGGGRPAERAVRAPLLAARARSSAAAGRCRAGALSSRAAPLSAKEAKPNPSGKRPRLGCAGDGRNVAGPHDLRTPRQLLSRPRRVDKHAAESLC
jgi:hypothetical protein